MHPILDSIEFITYPNARLRCANGVVFHASMNEHNRQKLDAMTVFPELHIEDFNAHHGMLTSDDIEVTVYLEKECSHDSQTTS